LLAHHLHADPRVRVVSAICKKDLEGIVAKRKDGVYSVSGQWLEVLNPNYSQHEGRHEKFTAFQKRRMYGS
jgi:hypothetical protein